MIQNITTSTYNETIIQNLSWISKDLNGLRYSCQIDTINVINSYAKLPKIAFLFLAISLLLITLYIFIPKINQYIRTKDILFFQFMLILTSTFLYMFLTFNITSETFNTIIKPILYTISGIGIIYIIYKERASLKELYRRIKEND